jgi:hypothetical protein
MIRRAEDGVGQAAAFGLRRRRHLGEQRQFRPPSPARRVSNRIQTSQNTPKAMAARDSVKRDLVRALARRCMRQRRPVECGADAHERFPSFLRSCDSSSLDSASTTKVMKNSTSPR